MKKITSTLFHDSFSTGGLILIILSFSIFLFTAFTTADQASGAFMINYALSAMYLLTLFFRTLSIHGWKLAKGSIQHTVLMLILWFISAFALNRSMNVFDDSVTWLSIWIMVSSIVLIVAAFFHTMPAYLRNIVYFLLGGALVLFAYYALYLVPLYPLSVVCLIAIGISFHTFIPACLTIVTIIIITRLAKANKKILYPVAAGVIVPILICIAFCVWWGKTNNSINLTLNQNSLTEAKLPAWVAVSQHVKSSPVLERILKSGLVYREVNPDRDFWWGMPSKSFDEPKKHDPLVVMATLLHKKPNLDENERIKILKSIYNARHQAQERLWSGDDLETISVISNIKLFPEYRMAYTEKTLTVRNNSKWQWSNQEGIYTFHLSEGSVITSLSLWIKGNEEKSRLTTKAKADSAYKQVVGVESHDPSVVHWQEGNTITVRVFPCTPEENRKFRIGITSPLQKEGDRLVYENPYFEGPNATQALETMQLSFSEKPAALQIPADFKQNTVNVYRADRTYQPNWEISCKATALANTVFAFADSAYQVKNYEPQYEAFTPQAIYLDLNSAWTLAELKQVWEKVKQHPVYVYNEELIKLSDNNLQDVYSVMSDQNFSLFPVNEIKDPEHALIISKSNDAALNLNDLEGSAFAKDLSHYLKAPKNIRFYNISYQLTPYLKAFKEFRVFNYAHGSIDDLAGMLNSNRFIKNPENDSTVVLENAQMLIQKTAETKTQNAPDHLLRLFAYNDIMKKVGANYFNNNYIQPDIIGEADKAYVVSPVSSLIVLETQKDYERFNIAESKDSLKNASMKSSGSVPEPHEWVLIILSALFILYIIFKQKTALQKTAC